ncbi:MAG: N-acetylmuramoyl-L-alanine amidase [Myxococcota bacterium]
MRRSRIQLAWLIVMVAPLFGISRPPGLSDVIEVRHWSYGDYTRVVVELSRSVSTKVVHLPENREADKSERLYLDLPGFWVGRDYESGIEVGDGLLRGVRLGQNTRTKARVVIDVDSYQRHRLMVLTHPDRIVIDVYGRSKVESSPYPAGGRVRTVIVDPGHGGSDPGAIGVGGLKEKDVTMRLARVLSRQLEARGFLVVLTRKSDKAVSLEERTAIAEANHGDVFISLHANAAPRRSVNGIETYYPDQNHERHSLRVAMRENGVTREQLDDLQRTLAKLRIAEISPRSARLASLVQTQLTSELPSRYGKIQDLGAKRGPFYVLFLSNMPAILIEAGFLTNRTEARRLRSSEYLESVASQIAVGVERYRDARNEIARRSS